MAFDWDSLPEASPQSAAPAAGPAAAPAFNWESHPEVTSAPAQNPGTSKITTATTGLLDAGAGVGQVAGALGTTALNGITGVSGPLAGGSLHDLVEDYRRNHEKLTSDFAKAAAAHPAISLASKMAGGGLALGAVGPAALSQEGMAATGAIAGLGNSPNDLTQINDPKVAAQAIQDASTGAATNLVAGSVLGGIQQGLKSGAGKLAEAATGATGIFRRNNFKPGTGNMLLESGTVGFGDSPGDIAQKAQAGIDAAQTQKMDILQNSPTPIMSDRNKMIAYLQSKISGMSGNEAQNGLKAQLEKRIEAIADEIPESTTQQTGFMQADKPVQLSPAVHANDATFMNPSTLKPARYINGSNVDQWAGLRGPEVTPAVEMTPISPKFEGVPGDSTIPIAQAEQNRIAWDKKARWDGVSDSDALAANKETANAYRQTNEDAITAAGGDDGAQGAAYKAAKTKQSMLIPVAEAAEKRASTLNQSPIGGLLDTSRSAAGAVVGHQIGGVPGMVAGALTGISGRAIAPRIPASAAVTADMLSKFLSPEAMSGIASRGPTAIAATDFILQQTSQAYRDHRNLTLNPEDTGNGNQ